MTQHITSFDLFYISYDEPKKEEYWAKIVDQAPWAKRVDGVKGFDSAHKACAEQSETDRFITIDGDNIVYPEFFDLQFEIPEKLKDKTLSWGGRNIINGLCYGNGGLKLWTKDFVLGMRTHENADHDDKKVDFCWDDNYVQMNNVYSDTCPNGSPFQAFRAGFREGVKMTLDRGAKADVGTIAKQVHDKNYKRLLIWATIGADVENGDWAIYGTRLGIYSSCIDKSFDISQISDYDWFKKYFEKNYPNPEYFKHTGALESLSSALLEPLQKQLGMNIANFTPEQSLFFKSVYEPPVRTQNPIVTEFEASL